MVLDLEPHCFTSEALWFNLTRKSISGEVDQEWRQYNQGEEGGRDAGGADVGGDASGAEGGSDAKGAEGGSKD